MRVYLQNLQVKVLYQGIKVTGPNYKISSRRLFLWQTWRSVTAIAFFKVCNLCIRWCRKV